MKFVRLLATLCVSFLSTGCTGLDQANSTRVLTPPVRNSSYVYDSSTYEGYYSLSYNDSAFNDIFNVEGDSFTSYNPNHYTDYYFPMLTFMFEGISTYYPCGAYDNVDDMFVGIANDIYDHYSSLDFFVIDIPYFATINNSLYLQNWIRYYGIGEQKLGAICYFEDNSAYYLWSSDYGTSYCFFDVFNMNNLNYDDTSSSSRGHLITTSESDIYFKRLYTETRPMLLSYSSNVLVNGTPSSLRSETYLYPFHFERHAEGNGALFDYTDAESYKVFQYDYLLKFGFSYANSSTGYESGYKEGYDVGKDDGYDEGVADMQDDIDIAYDHGYQEGYYNGTADLNTQVDNAHQQGVNEGWAAATNNPYTFAALFGAIADTPIMILRNLLGFEIFGVDAIAILMTMITGCIAIFLIRKFF